MEIEKNIKKILLLFLPAIFAVGCGYKKECYTPSQKQSFEKISCYKYDEALISDHRFVLLDDKIWMQFEKNILISARDFNITINDKDSFKTTSFRVIGSDHPLSSFSNLLIDIDEIKKFEKIESFEYRATNIQSEIEPQKLGGFSLKALQNIINEAKKESLKKEARNESSNHQDKQGYY